MNNKKGGAGGKILLVLILMIASAIGGAYAYRAADGKMAARDAMKAVEKVDISDYDTPEQTVIQEYIDKTTKDLETAQTRKQVYEILTEFIADVDKVQTSKEKELEKALKEAEDAKKKLEEQQKNNNSTATDNTGQTTDSTGTDSSKDNSKDSGYKSNDLTNADEGTENSGSGFLDSLLGGLASGSGN